LNSILYPLIANPPLLDGAAQDKLTWVADDAVATSPVGALGTLEDDEDVGVAEVSDDAALVPMELIAETR
jgi:hypothetical protein